MLRLARPEEFSQFSKDWFKFSFEVMFKKIHGLCVYELFWNVGETGVIEGNALIIKTAKKRFVKNKKIIIKVKEISFLYSIIEN